MIQPSTLSNWLSETAELCRFSRMRPYALQKYAPKDMIASATLAHPVTSLFLPTCNGVNRLRK